MKLHEEKPFEKFLLILFNMGIFVWSFFSNYLFYATLYKFYIIYFFESLLMSRCAWHGSRLRANNNQCAAAPKYIKTFIRTQQHLSITSIESILHSICFLGINTNLESNIQKFYETRPQPKKLMWFFFFSCSLKTGGDMHCWRADSHAEHSVLTRRKLLDVLWLFFFHLVIGNMW